MASASTQEEIDETTAKFLPLLEVRGLTKVFGRLVALGGIDLTVGENEFHGLIGPNGSGKNTLMKCVAGAELPTEGTIRFAGRDMTTAAPAKRTRAGLSLKFQITSVLPARHTERVESRFRELSGPPPSGR
jgi:branched-chain amino acid transport system ATP-binding protein